uniref:hypothetical protein n=1 Tax=Nitrospira cf. moscoviensis SBR1015 TaxID=96242 RepID=UPI001181249F|nr:hypothetical protein [Nitrospira cf. moscoviensis SBR1015]
MFTTLDAKPQEWMQGDPHVLHTVAACHFTSPEHAEHWINLLVPKNRNGKFVKWAGGRRKDETRDAFLAACVEQASKFDFSVTCVSSYENEMSWFAWAFYYQNQHLITQGPDAKGRNCLKFELGNEKSIEFPVLRAGYLIWYSNVVRYLSDSKRINGRFLSDNFCNDEVGPGAGKARGVGFVNYLLSMRDPKPQISLPTNDRFFQLDLLSDHFCGFANTVWSGVATDQQTADFNKLEQSRPNLIENMRLATDLTIVDQNGVNVTAQVKAAVAKGSVDG